jgi:LuxR family transcriptional regulator, maltose regulon positive regulatory protein
MPTELLASKLFTPLLRPSLVQRQGLMDNLMGGLSGKVTLVSAPAGFGKSTLVSEWVRNCGRPVAWLSLDKNDNDLSRFLTYLIAALQHIDENIGTDILAALSESQSPKFEILLARLINEIEAIPVKTILILDDYHLIDSKPVHDALNFLVEYLAPTMHLVVSGRADPPLPISRLRVQGQVNEIRIPELRFTKRETAIFLNDLMGFDLSSEDVVALEERTEGWIASLQLAALSMKGRDDWHEFIIAFSGSHRYVIDYLMDEVMSRQPENIGVFLRRTSILDRFCAPLCEAVVDTEMESNEEILSYLERSNLFLIRLDDHRKWYRYHHLFAEFLRQRLRQEEPEHIPDLYRRASQWYETEGMVDDAIRYALAGRDVEGATRLVDGIAAALVQRRECSKLKNLIKQLPSAQPHDYPMLCIWHAWALLFLGDLDTVEPVLRIAESNRDKAPKVPINSYAAIVRACLANRMGEFHKAIYLIEQAFEFLTEASTDQYSLIYRGAAILWLGINHRALGDLDKARGFFFESASLNEEAGSIYGALAAVNQLADVAVIQGQLYHAVEIYQRGFQMAQKWMDDQGKGLRTLLAMSELHLGFGTLLYEINDLSGAAPHIRRAAELLELADDHGRFHACKMLAYLNQAHGNYESAYDLLDKACTIQNRRIVRRSNMTEEPSLEQLRILLSRSDPEMAHLVRDVARRIETLELRPDNEIDFSSQADYPHELDYSDLARILVAQGQALEALPLLKRLMEAAHSMGRNGDEIRYLVLTALAHHTLEDTPIALDFLSQALTQAEPQGYVRLFVDEGQPMAELLLAAVSQNIAPDYASKLLAAFPKDIHSTIQYDTGLTVNKQSLVEPLSEREIEVLHLMAEGYKYQEIAERLVISINTVRHHNRNIFGKLNVNSRMEAIDRARQMHLL